MEKKQYNYMHAEEMSEKYRQISISYEALDKKMLKIHRYFFSKSSFQLKFLPHLQFIYANKPE